MTTAKKTKILDPNLKKTAGGVCDKALVEVDGKTYMLKDGQKMKWCYSEVFAYRLGTLLGMRVPASRIVFLDELLGNEREKVHIESSYAILQEWMDSFQTASVVDKTCKRGMGAERQEYLRYDDMLLAKKRDCEFFDFLLNNSDRNATNYGVCTETGEAIYLDHNYSSPWQFNPKKDARKCFKYLGLDLYDPDNDQFRGKRAPIASALAKASGAKLKDVALTLQKQFPVLYPLVGGTLTRLSAIQYYINNTDAVIEMHANDGGY